MNKGDKTMASWVTHLMIADRVLEIIPKLDRHSFCVGNIAPDCNVENEDWTKFVPSREITHWMSADRKVATDCERFYDEYIAKREQEIDTEQERSFFLGYYAHLIADAEFQRYIREVERVTSAWARIKAHPVLSEKAKDMPENWDSVKKLINKNERMKDIYTIEAEYLEKNPGSGYLTEILGLKTFPDYIDYLPKGAIVRKIGVMGYLPKKELGAFPFVAMTREEYSTFLDMAIEKIVCGINDTRCHFKNLNTGCSY